MVLRELALGHVEAMTPTAPTHISLHQSRLWPIASGSHCPAHYLKCAPEISHRKPSNQKSNELGSRSNEDAMRWTEDASRTIDNAG